MKEWDEPGRFVTIPGYEWSGNTALGGDRNVFYEPGAEFQLSKLGRAFIAGVLAHAAEITAVRPAGISPNGWPMAGE